MDKSLFSDNCEGGNILNTLISNLAAPEHHHAFLEDQHDLFQDAWEEAQAGLLNQEHPYTQFPGGVNPDLEQAWKDSELEQAWQEPLFDRQMDPLSEELSIKDSARSIMSMLSLQGDPKFVNSEFFKFVSRLESGKAKIQGNELIEDLEDVWSASKPDLSQEEMQRFEEVWQTAQESNEKELLEAWGNAWQAPEKTNPYLGLDDLEELRDEMMKKGQFDEASLMAEAHLARNDTDSAGWLALGQLYSAMDRDDEALRCFKSGLAHDPYNTGLLLASIVSSISQYDHSELPSLLANYLSYDPNYAGIIVPPGGDLHSMLGCYLSALELNPSDFNLTIVIGMINLALSDLTAAEYYFERANSLRPNNCEVINKLGVALMQQSRYEEAIFAFSQSVKLNKEYVKGWVNLAKCYTTAGEYHKAAEAYLTAATLTKSEHIYELLRSLFSLMERPDLVPRLQHKDPSVFSDEFEIYI